MVFTVHEDEQIQMPENVVVSLYPDISGAFGYVMLGHFVQKTLKADCGVISGGNS